MITSLLTEPFAQQALLFAIDTVQSTEIATMPIVQYYNSTLTGAGGPGIDRTMEDALLNPWLAYNNPYAAVTPDCPTGNCTFSTPYSSFAMCYQCNNVAPKIVPVLVAVYHGLDGWQFYPGSTDGIGLVTQNCQPSQALGRPLPPDGIAQSGNHTGLLSKPPNLLTNFAQDYFQAVTENTISFKNSSSVLAVWTYAGFYDCEFWRKDPKNATSTPLPQQWAFECGLIPCVKTFTSTVTNGSVSETLVSTSRQEGWVVDQDEWAYSYESWGWFNITNPDCNPSGSVDCLFGATQRELYEMGSYITSAIPKEIISPGGIYNSGNVEDAMANFTTAITNAMRMSNTEGLSTTVTGTVLKNETVLKVRWIWLTYPAAHLVLALVFLIWTMIRSRGQVIWKSSVLILLCRGPKDTTPKIGAELGSGSLTSLDNVTAIERDAASVRVALRRDKSNFGELRLLEDEGGT